MQGEISFADEKAKPLSAAEASALKRELALKNLGGLYYDVPPIGCVVR